MNTLRQGDPQYQRLPNYFFGSMQRYLIHGVPTGSFLHAVMSNDLKHAVECADDDNRERLWVYVLWMVNYLPSITWGSGERIKNWVELTNDQRIAVIELSRCKAFLDD